MRDHCCANRQCYTYIVARVRHRQQALWHCRRVQLLAAGDAAALLLFAAAGRANHGELLGLELLTTALPFWAGVLLIACSSGNNRPAYSFRVSCLCQKQLIGHLVRAPCRCCSLTGGNDMTGLPPCITT